ncbi:AAA family ATPase [Sulfurovum sp. bin170]|uniref:AAA family ATPase n=1 Tax=Sulfurovum sp. bin170 TaxID=2695268 RepID=UPI0013DECC8A|nr:AAA family ATPase [Sulfurovum sp. bin170]NEW60496.1 AAA family ATPase [Sulfurovum sp. bin170]
MKKIIYGISNFKMAKEDNYLYIDKTKHIETLEKLNEKYLIFLRPRRFGKSLFLSTLQYYYDENSAHEFEAIFHDTYIGQNPTPLKSSYKILFFEFSGINTDSGMEIIYEGFKDNIKSAIYRYFSNYGYAISRESLNSIKTPTGLLKYFFDIVEDDKIYLLIDEYDQFANAILAYSMQDFLKTVSKGGFVRSFYEVIKGATQTGTVQKMFITGVTPITLDSLSSGFNIVSNISHDEAFNAMAGFTQKETEYSLEESIFKECDLDKKEEILEKIKIWYNGYIFNIKAQERIYNSTLLNYFISKFDYKRCIMPIKMLDVNVASDYRAIMKLFNIGDSDRNYKILEELIQNNSITGEIKDRYDLNREFSRDDFITLIYSMGFITIKEELFGEKYKFKIPNYVIKILYFNYFAVELKRRNNLKIDEDIGTILTDLALGDIEPFDNQLSVVIKVLANRDHMGLEEKHFQVITLSLLSFASFYFIESQPEKNNKYPDILLIGRDEKVPNNYMFELKWIKQKDDYKQMKKEGIEQVEGYLKLDKVKNIPKLRSFLLMGSKDGVEFLEIN